MCTALTPTNVATWVVTDEQVLTASGHVRLVDFGFCKEADERGYLYNKVGTPHYLAPELLDKHVDKRGYTRAVDWWAFGCLMYEMLAGKVRPSRRRVP